MRVTRLQKLATDESGFSMVFVGLGCMAFVAASMLAIDVGMLMTARSQAQNAADAGALAGATSLAYDDYYDRSATGPAGPISARGRSSPQRLANSMTQRLRSCATPLHPCRRRRTSIKSSQHISRACNSTARW